MRIRPSKLGHIDLCTKYDQVDNPEVTSLGTLVHMACATGDLTGLNEDDKAAVEAAHQLVAQQRLTLKEPVRDLIEHPVNITSIDLKGTIDRLLLSPDTALVIDWKTGPAGLPDDADDSLQVQAYMLGVLDNFPEIQTVIGTLTNPRTMSMSADLRITRETAPGVIDRIKRIIERAEDPFSAPTPGSHCTKCKHAARCWALVPTIKASAGVVMPGILELLRDPETANPTPPMRTARAILRGIMERWCDAIKDADNEYIKAGNEPPPGFRRQVRSTGLRIPERERMSAMSALRNAGIGDDIIAAGCNIALGKVIDALTLAVGDKKLATKQVYDAVEGIAVEGSTEFMTRDKGKNGIDDAALFAMIRKSIGLAIPAATEGALGGKEVLGIQAIGTL